MMDQFSLEHSDAFFPLCAFSQHFIRFLKS